MRTPTRHVALFGALALVGCADEAPTAPEEPETFSMRVELDLTDGAYIEDGVSSPCTGQGGFADIKAGTQVVVTDADGKTVGVANLSAGSISSTLVCTFATSVPDLPVGSAFYGVEASQRGVIQVSAEEAAGDGAHLTLR